MPQGAPRQSKAPQILQGAPRSPKYSEKTARTIATRRKLSLPLGENFYSEPKHCKNVKDVRKTAERRCENVKDVEFLVKNIYVFNFLITTCTSFTFLQRLSDVFHVFTRILLLIIVFSEWQYQFSPNSCRGAPWCPRVAKWCPGPNIRRKPP